MPNAEWPSYKAALHEVALRRMRGMLFPVNPMQSHRPDMALDSATQAKIVMACNLMMAIGRGPGDMPVDQRIEYRFLPPQSIGFLTEKLKVAATREFAPFAADYASIFQGGKWLSGSKKAGRFYSHLIHIFVIEAQLVLTQQYYYGLELDQDRLPISALISHFSEEEIQGMRLGQLSKLDITDLHGRIFFEYLLVMIRAQWDKLIRLLCMAFEIKDNWSSIDDGIESLKKPLQTLKDTERWHLDALIHVAEFRLNAEQGWLRPFRDSLLHKTGLHSEGIIAQSKSLETTAQLWKKAKDEHNWWREAVMTAIIVFALIANA
ncbi:MAG: hypothetical protein K8J31_10820 [Anaerolineae bacterium]|nr:hypothetical protein [Anaerolineae bacterium]